MKDSLLVALQKYRKRDNYNPDENFLTEAFAWLLRNDHEAHKQFLKLIGEPDQKVHWTTQYYLRSGGFVDLMGDCTNGNRLVIEIKIDACLAENQIEKYRHALTRKNASVKTILITRKKSQRTQECDISLIWAQVFEAFAQIPTQDHIFISEFLSLLKHHNLQPPPAFDMSVFTQYPAYLNLYDHISSEIKQLVKKDWAVVAGFNRSQFDNKWGRLGLRWERVKGDKPGEIWNPALFSGFVLNPRDHQIECLCENQTIFTFIVSFGNSYWDALDGKNSAEWTEFVKTVRDLYEKDGWRVYDPKNDSVSGKWNHWHRLFIWKRLTEEDNQAAKLLEEFEENTKKFITTIPQQESFKTLCNSLMQA